MKTSTNLRSTLRFLEDLSKNNNKAWFEANRARYEEAKADFEDFVQALIGEIDKFDNLGMLQAKDCIFRLNRDLRFSKDKTPYKTNFGALIAPGGKKSTQQGYYMHIAPHNASFVGGGLHMPTPEQLAKFRQAIDRDSTAFKKIINSKEFQLYFGPLEGEKLKLMPKGYAATHPDIEILKLKEVTTGTRLTDKEILAPDVAQHVARLFKTMKPFLKYIDSVLQ